MPRVVLLVCTEGRTGIQIFKAGAFHHAHTSQVRGWTAPRTHGRNARGPLTDPREAKDEHNASFGESNVLKTWGGHITEYNEKVLFNFKIKL